MGSEALLEPRPCLLRVPLRLGDHPGVVRVGRIASPQPERFLGVVARLVELPVLVERPAEGVGSLDVGRRRVRRLRQGQRRGRIAVLGLEERHVEVGVDAVGLEQRLDLPDQRVGLLCVGVAAGSLLRLSLGDEELGERNAVGGGLVARDRLGQVAASGVDSGDAGEREDVAGQQLERGSIGAVRPWSGRRP